jgi:hypothetical protein
MLNCSWLTCKFFTFTLWGWFFNELIKIQTYVPDRNSSLCIVYLYIDLKPLSWFYHIIAALKCYMHISIALKVTTTLWIVCYFLADWLSRKSVRLSNVYDKLIWNKWDLSYLLSFKRVLRCTELSGQSIT